MKCADAICNFGGQFELTNFSLVSHWSLHSPSAQGALFSFPLGWKLAFRRLGFGDFGIVIALTSWLIYVDLPHLRNGYVYPRNLQKPDNLDLRMSISCKWYWVYTSELASKNLRRQGSQHIGHIPTLHVVFFRRWKANYHANGCNFGEMLPQYQSDHGINVTHTFGTKPDIKQWWHRFYSTVASGTYYDIRR